VGAHNVLLVRTLVFEEIRRIVAEAVEDGTCVPASSAARQIVTAYPNCGWAERDVVNEIIMTAARAGVAVEFGPSAKASAGCATREAA
jgi:hypothetical protein